MEKDKKKIKSGFLIEMYCNLPDSLNICTLGSGSKGNAFALTSNQFGTLLVDAGFSAKQMENKLATAQIDIDSINAVLLTHDHDDHSHGCRVFCDKYNIPLYCSYQTAHYLNGKNKLPNTVVQFEAGDRFEINGFQISAFAVQHDAIDPVGFRIKCHDKEIGIATDLGEINALCKQRLSLCDALILESNYDREMLYASDRALHLKRRIAGRMGHLDNNDALTALEELLSDRSSLLMLVHISNDCNCYELVEKNLSCCLEKIRRNSMEFYVARQHEVSPWFTI